MGQWVTNNIFSVYFITISVNYEEQKMLLKNVIVSVGHHQWGRGVGGGGAGRARRLISVRRCVFLWIQ